MNSKGKIWYFNGQDKIVSLSPGKEGKYLLAKQSRVKKYIKYHKGFCEKYGLEELCP